MSSYIIGKADDDDFDCILQLEEMYQVCVHAFILFYLSLFVV